MYPNPYHISHRTGFTLIELSIVLVIIGLIIGGVLVGKSLITDAQIKAQISQIQHYDAAANTFHDKYGNLPGDLPAAMAAQFGFIARSGAAMHGDGNDLIDTCFTNNDPFGFSGCETLLFWSDLAMAGLIEGSYTLAADSYVSFSVAQSSSYVPPAKIGSGNSVVMIGRSTCSPAGPNCITPPPATGGNFTQAGTPYVNVVGNFYGIGGNVAAGGGQLQVDTALNTIDASAIDAKMDDGLPYSGSVWASGIAGLRYSGFVATTADNTSTSACVYASTTTPYYIYNTVNGASNKNCMLVIKGSF